jgi:hypothetical protein
MRRLGVWVACLAVVLALAGAADARTILLGILGDAERFERQTGQQSTVRHAILGWEQGLTWGSRLAVTIPGLGPVPMVASGRARGGPTVARRSPPGRSRWGRATRTCSP